jgi:hypothetical protein
MTIASLDIDGAGAVAVFESVSELCQELDQTGLR